MKLTKMLLIGATLATATLTSLANVQADTAFKDVPANHWSSDAIMHLKDKKNDSWLWKWNVWIRR